MDTGSGGSGSASFCGCGESPLLYFFKFLANAFQFFQDRITLLFGDALGVNLPRADKEQQQGESKDCSHMTVTPKKGLFVILRSLVAHSYPYGA